jgi:hypothetical protein
MHGPMLPWAFGPLSGLRSRLPPDPTSGTLPPGLFTVPFGVVGGGRLVVPVVLPCRTDSLCEVFAPSAGRRRLVRAYRIASVKDTRTIYCRRDDTVQTG